MVRKIVANNTLLDEASALIANGEDVVIPTKGNSMFPFIIGGRDTILLTAPTNIEVGDIVMAKINNTTYVVHRIIKISGDQITLMGDGNISGVEICTKAQITAKAKSIIHKNQMIDCNSAKQRRRARLWRTLQPIRRYIIGIWRRTPFWN